IPEAPGPTPVLSITSTSGSSPAARCSLARCHAVDRPWMPAPMIRYLALFGRLTVSSSLPLRQWYFSGVRSSVPERLRECTRARQQGRPRGLALLSAEAPGRALYAENSGQLPAAAVDRSGDRVQVDLALAHRLGPALLPHRSHLTHQPLGGGDRAVGVRLQLGTE